MPSFNLKNGSSFEGYVVLECLGRAGEGEVYRILDQYSGSERALKIFFPELGFRFIAQYTAKLERLREINGIIKYHHGGYWTEYGCYYMVLELVRGKDLAKVSRNHPFPVFKALQVARQLFRIVAYCHHLKKECLADLELTNIILSKEEKVTVIDIDARARFTKRNIREDIGCVCEIFYELNWNRGPYPRDLRKTIPKCQQTIEKRYRSANQALEAIEELMGARQSS